MLQFDGNEFNAQSLKFMELTLHCRQETNVCELKKVAL